MNRTVAAFGLLGILAACTKEQPGTTAERRVEDSRVTPSPPAPPRRTIDPRSSEAAEELVRAFVGLLNDGHVGDAYMLLGPTAPGRAQFEHQWSSYTDLRVTSGDAGPQEGAAGSVYVSVPLGISAALHGRHVRRSATAVLRRVNDVDGSTEAQRRWHIERIDFEDDAKTG